MTLLKMACNRRKKTVLYGLGVLAVVYMGVQVVYFSETFTPLMMLSDAQSEASRLLKFISLYHYQCNSTIQLFNRTDWPLCTDKKYGLDVDGKGPRIAYSIGPTWDFGFERNLVYNHSYNLFIFSLDDIPRDLKEINRTHFYKTMIVANDPADFGRNSYGTQTLNSVMDAFHHQHLDILKIERLADRSHAYELLYYMAEDHILHRVQQLHVAVHIDKLDDDYLYRWYRAFYNLFYLEGFRLYHTAASDSLCLQVTMMESCVYYTSWVRDPGPRVFVMHPPAIDGSIEFEEQRLVNYLSTVQDQCDNMEVLSSGVPPASQHAPKWENMAHCVSDIPDPCHVVVVSMEPISLSHHVSLSGKRCEMTSLSPSTKLFTEPHFVMTLSKKRQALKRLSNRNELSLKEIATILNELQQLDFVYLDLSASVSAILTPVLDSGFLQNVRQVGIDLVLSPDPQDKHPVNLRRTFSELRRLKAQGFHIYHTSEMRDSKLYFVSQRESEEDCCFRVSFINRKQTAISP